ncbi:MAG: hypothetical protein IPM13_18455 [Phycisphaerales bacterium]|nr:hypothetical protein [Phycisphaerales bacterium]
MAAQERTDFIFHVYVDPHYGDNALATAQNPGTGGPVLPLGGHRDPGPPSPPAMPIVGRLVHAPYSFLTVTGAQGALAYIAAAFPGGLPWDNGFGFTVEKVVIHCLPGLYGPRLQGQPIVDPTNGLPWNGETFPAVLQHGVSIRGTSALTSIFDARGRSTRIFETNVPQFAARNQFDFINGVTIRGARSTVNSARGDGAGVYIHGMGSCFLTVSNCFITDNTVGIAVASEIDPKQEPIWVHQPMIVNNTIAWNSIGIWNGDFGPLTVQSDGPV